MTADPACPELRGARPQQAAHGITGSEAGEREPQRDRRLDQHRARGKDDAVHGEPAIDPVHPRIARNASSACSISAIRRSEEHTSELQSLMRISYAVFSLKKNTHQL